MDFFTADTHLGHANIIKYCDRPFQTVEQMDDTIINNINEVVKANDRLYHVGDFSYRGGAKAIPAYRRRINCKNVFIVPGNHDRESQLKGHFIVLPQCYMYENDGFRIVLCHYAMRVWEHSHHGAGMLYGHSHGGLPIVPGAPTFDCGVDSWNMSPINLFTVKQQMKYLCTLGVSTPGTFVSQKNSEHMHHQNPVG